MADPNQLPSGGEDDPWIGQTFAGYTVLQLIGGGGMGVLYLARHKSLDRLAAVKFLPSEMASNEAFIELFLREAKAAAKLSHPNIVGVHDAGSLGPGVYYFIMEYVEGESLGEILQKSGPIPVPKAVDYVKQAASALAYAHKKQVVHRDIKPENLLLTTDGNVKVVDLGLAKWAGEEQSMVTQTGDIMGSPIYISPERLRDPHTVDPRTDIYSLGGTLYNLVTDRIPYEGSAPVIMARHLTDPVPNPRDVKPDLDDAICAIIMKMMAKDVRDRYQTMEEVESALKDYLAGKPAALGSVAGAQKNTWLIPAVVVAVAAVGGFYVASIYLKPSPPKAGASVIAEKPVPALPVKPPEPPPPPKPAEAPVTQRNVADFNGDSRLTRLGTTFGCWSSSEPVGRASEHVERNGGVNDSGYWKIDFDITVPKSYSGAWLKLGDIDGSEYDTLVFNAKAAGLDKMNFIVELKGRTGATQGVGRYTVSGLNNEWKSFEVPLKSFRLSSLKSLTELTIVFDPESTGSRKGSLCLDNLALIKKH